MSEAKLGLVIDSGQAKRAAVDLDALDKSATKVDATTGRLAANFKAATAPVVDFTKRLSQGMSEVGAAHNAALMANERLVAGMSMGSARAQMSVAALGNQTKQLSFQLFDIAQGIPLVFDSPRYALMNLATQTGQVAQLYQGQGGLKQAFADTKAMAISLGASLGRFLVSPLGLAAAAAGVAGVAILAVFAHERAQAQRAEEALKKHIDLIGRIKDAYKDAGAAAGSYAAESIRVLHTIDQEQQRIVKEQLNRQAANLGAPLGVTPRGFGLPGGGAIREASDAIKQLNKEGRDGVADWKRFGDALVTALNNPAINRGQRDIIQGLLDIAQKAMQAQVQLRQVAPPSFRQTEQQSAKDELKYVLEQKAQVYRIRQGLDADLTAIRAKSPADKGVSAALLERINLTGEAISQDERDARVFAAGARAREEAEYAIAQAQMQRKMALDAMMESAQLDVDLIGKGAAATEQFRMQQQLLAQLRQEAFANGVPMDQAEIDLIKQKAAEYGKLVELQQRSQLRSDLGFERSQFGRSGTEQRVAEQMRGIYNDDFLSHMHDFEAEQIRINERLKELDDIGREITVGGFHDFFDSIREGKGFFDSLGVAGENALNKIEDKLIDMAANRAWDAILGMIAGAVGNVALPGSTPVGQGGIGHPTSAVGPPISGSHGPNVLQFPQRPAAAPSVSPMKVVVNNYGNDNVSVSADSDGTPVVNIAQREQAARRTRRGPVSMKSR